MSKNKTPTVPEGSGMGDQDDINASSPATRLLDALGRGDLNAAAAGVPADDHRPHRGPHLVGQGEEDVLYWLEEAFERFPGLVFDSHARHVGYGQVIEEARVRDIGPLDPHPALPRRRPAGPGADQPRLNMPVRLTVLHDDGYVHEIIASYPQALLRSALGQHVDPLDMAVSEIQSAFVASAGSGFKTYQMGSGPQHETEYAQAAAVPLARVEPSPSPRSNRSSSRSPCRSPSTRAGRPPPYVPEEEDEKPRRRALVAVPVVMALVAAIAAGSWWLGRDDNAAQADAKPGKAGQSAGQNKGNAKPTKKPSSSSPKPTPSKMPQVVIKSNKPTVTLKSDLAFDKGSAELSDAAKTAIGEIADAVREARLQGHDLRPRLHRQPRLRGVRAGAVPAAGPGRRAVPARLARRLHDHDHRVLSRRGRPDRQQRHRGRPAAEPPRDHHPAQAPGSDAPRLEPWGSAGAVARRVRDRGDAGQVGGRVARALSARASRAGPLTEAEQESLLRDGTFDLALVRLPVDRDGLHVITLYDEVPVVVAGPEHLIAAADEVTLADLVDEQLVLPHRSGWQPDAPSSPGPR